MNPKLLRMWESIDVVANGVVVMALCWHCWGLAAALAIMGCIGALKTAVGLLAHWRGRAFVEEG